MAIRRPQGRASPFELSWNPAYASAAPKLDASSVPPGDGAAWTEWSGRSNTVGPTRIAVTWSLITLKAMIYAPSGGIVAAPTASCRRRSGVCATGIIATAGCATRP